MKHFLFILVAILCHSDLLAQDSFRLKLSAESTVKLISINKDLKARDRGVSFTCGEETCDFMVDFAKEPDIDAGLINRPFSDGELLAIRVYSGNEGLASGLYESLGRFTTTDDFKGILDARVLRLDQEGERQERVKFRCVATRDETPQHECWLIIWASALVDQE